MADKVLIPGAFGLTNYRSQLSRPIMGRVNVRGRGRQAGYNRPRIPFRPPDVYDFIPNRDIAHDVGQYMYRPPPKRKSKKQYKPKKCCRYIRGKKRCSPKFCGKKFYRRKFYWY